MIEHSSHIGFIIAAYAVATVVIASMIIVIVADHRALRRSLEQFGSRGLDRTGSLDRAGTLGPE